MSIKITYKNKKTDDWEHGQVEKIDGKSMLMKPNMAKTDFTKTPSKKSKKEEKDESYKL